MGVDLIGREGATFGWRTWRGCLELARAFGWNPAGTVAPVGYDGGWKGWYDSNDFQEVTKDDAGALGAALHQALGALRTGQALTKEQAQAADSIPIGEACKLADYAISGGFAIA